MSAHVHSKRMKAIVDPSKIESGGLDLWSEPADPGENLLDLRSLVEDCGKALLAHPQPAGLEPARTLARDGLEAVRSGNAKEGTLCRLPTETIHGTKRIQGANPIYTEGEARAVPSPSRLHPRMGTGVGPGQLEREPFKWDGHPHFGELRAWEPG